LFAKGAYTIAGAAFEDGVNESKSNWQNFADCQSLFVHSSKPLLSSAFPWPALRFFGLTLQCSGHSTVRSDGFWYPKASMATSDRIGARYDGEDERRGSALASAVVNLRSAQWSTTTSACNHGDSDGQTD
jgi:hypothetical protein